MSRTPVILLSGFLGAGKTTLLTRLIPAAARANIKAAVLMNESGAVSIDGPIAQGEGIDVVDVLGGCVCCALKGELHEALKEILDRFAPQLIIVETTGIADPLEVVDACTATDLVTRLDPRGVVTVVDAAHGSAALQINELARRQVELADILIINKVDLAKPDSLVPLWMELKAANGRAGILETTQANVDADKLLKSLLGVATKTEPGASAPGFPKSNTGLETPALTRGAPLNHDHDHDHGHHHGNRHGYLALSYRVQPPRDKQHLLELLRALPANVVRAKGFLRLAGDERVYICQLAGGYAQASVFPLPGFDPEPVLVVIGKALDRNAVETVLGPLMPEEL